jgi:hypothetical protein
MKAILLTLVVSLSMVSISFAQNTKQSPVQTKNTKQVTSVPALKKVIWVWLENTHATDMITMNYVNSIFYTYNSVKFTAYTPVAKTTQGNAFALITGSDQGIQDNDLTRVAAPSLVDLMEKQQVAWRVYAESYPSSCYLAAGTGDYRRYRVPFVSLDKVESNRYLCMKILGFRNFNSDVQTDTLPQVSIVIPGLANSGATTDTSTADYELQTLLTPILTNPDTLAQTTVIISTVNAVSSGDVAPEVFTMILGYGVSGIGNTVSTPYQNYNLLRTIEDGLKLGNLGKADATATPMTGFWAP